MAKKPTIKMPLEYVKKILTLLDLAPVDKELPDGKGTQLWLTRDGFSHVNINVFKTGAVVPQPYGDPAADFVRQILALRAARLRRKSKIPPNL